jgi:hypothetical protein
MNTQSMIVAKAYDNAERIEQIHTQREETMLDPEFQSWCKQLRIGIMVQQREGIDNANRMMEQWNNEVNSGLPEFIRRWF